MHTPHENHGIQNKLTMSSVPDPPVRTGDEKHTSSAARWVWVRDYIINTLSSSFFAQNVLTRISIALYHKYDSLQQLGSVEGLTKTGDPESIHTKNIHSGMYFCA